MQYSHLQCIKSFTELWFFRSVLYSKAVLQEKKNVELRFFFVCFFCS